MEKMIVVLQENLVIWGPKLLTAILIFIIGRWAAMAVKNITKKIMVKANVDETLVSFLANIIYIALLAFVIIAALARLGIQTASFIAVIGAAGLAIGLALQGSLSNFAAGVLMIIFKPFKVGDYIEGAGTGGTVEKIHIFTTQLVTPDNKTIIIPNSKIAGDNITNYNAKGTRRVDLLVGISYADDIDRARSIISDVLSQESRVFKDPAPNILVAELADSSVNFTVRPWAKSTEYWDVYFALTEKLKKRFDEEGISIPFPQRDVHLYEHKTQEAA